VYQLCLGPRRQGRAVAPSATSINYCALSSRCRLGSSPTSTRVPCVHALAARADFELPGWASRGAAVWAAAGISS